MSHKALVAGVGMVKFVKPGANEGYEVMAARAVNAALKDASLALGDIQQAIASYVYGDSGCGQRSIQELGLTGIPVFNVHNNCSAGSSAIYLARQAIESGQADCVLAFGFEQMQKGALGELWADRTPPGQFVGEALAHARPHLSAGPGVLQLFGSAGSEYLETYDAKPDLFAKVAVKTRRHAINNPYSLFTTPLTVDEVMASPIVYGDHLTKLMCCPPTCGAAAAIIVSDAFAKKHGTDNLVEIAGQGMATDTAALYESARNAAGQDCTLRAANIAYNAAALGPEDIDVVELHDCFTPNEILSYEALELCGEGDAGRMIEDGDNTYGGRYVVNPSGGLMSKGHPLGATGLAQCAELVWHLRGQAGKRQVPNTRVALQHNAGIPGGAVVTVYKATNI